MSDAPNSSVSGEYPHENITGVAAEASANGRQNATPKDKSADGSGKTTGHSESGRETAAPAPEPEGDGAVKADPSHTERRSRRRALISAPVRVRGVDVAKDDPDEISTTLDVSRSGFLFVSWLASFSVGMDVAVTFPYSKSPLAVQAEQPGRVARISELSDGRRAVAVALRVGIGEDPVDAGNRKLTQATSRTSHAIGKDSSKPVVLIVDADAAVRDSLKIYLTDEGYEVIAVSNAAEAHVVLTLFTPALLVAEIEGEDLPGYDLCARIKSTARLQAIPVMLTTRSAYPSDYANAHSLGAVVCMAKPFRLERLGHVVRLLAPTPQAKQQEAPPPRTPDPKRKGGAGHGAKARSTAKHPGRNGTRSRK